MSELPDHFVDIIRGDRFCQACGDNLRGAYVVREKHYQMLTTHCPSCGQIHPVQETRGLMRAGQRWAGLAMAFWFLLLLGMLVGTNVAMIGMTVIVLDECDRPLTEFIQEVYTNDHPDDAGGVFDTSVQFINTPAPGFNVVPGTTPGTGNVPPVITLTPGGATGSPLPIPPLDPISPDATAQVSTTPAQAAGTSGASPGSTNPSIQTFPAGPGRTIVVRVQNDELRERFSQWWPSQDAKAVLAQSGGYGTIIPWGTMWPFLFMGLAPLVSGFLWAIMVLNVSCRRMVWIWLVVGIWYLIVMGGMVLVMSGLTESPSHVAMAMLFPVLIPIAGAYFLALLLIGMLTGRPLWRGVVRLALSPRACSTMSHLWLVDGKAPPRVMAST